jgi:hypothetical protein
VLDAVIECACSTKDARVSNGARQLLICHAGSLLQLVQRYVGSPEPLSLVCAGEQAWEGNQHVSVLCHSLIMLARTVADVAVSACRQRADWRPQEAAAFQDVMHMLTSDQPSWMPAQQRAALFNLWQEAGLAVSQANPVPPPPIRNPAGRPSAPKHNTGTRTVPPAAQPRPAAAVGQAQQQQRPVAAQPHVHEQWQPGLPRSYAEALQHGPPRRPAPLPRESEGSSGPIRLIKYTLKPLVGWWHALVD